MSKTVQETLSLMDDLSKKEPIATRKWSILRRLIEQEVAIDEFNESANACNNYQNEHTSTCADPLHGDLYNFYVPLKMSCEPWEICEEELPILPNKGLLENQFLLKDNQKILLYVYLVEYQE